MYEPVIKVLETEMDGIRESQAVLAGKYMDLTDKVTVVREEQKQLSKAMTFKKGMLSALHEINNYSPFKGMTPAEQPRNVTITPRPDVRKIPTNEIQKPQNQGKGWSDSETDYVLDNYTKIPTSDIARDLNRTESAIINHAYIIGAVGFKKRKSKTKYSTE